MMERQVLGWSRGSKGPVSNYGEGGGLQNGRGWGDSKFYPY